MNKEFFIKNLWLWKCKIPEKQPQKKLDLYELMKSEWCYEFETLMRNRLLMGAFRYGTMNHTGKKNKQKYDRMNSMIKRLEIYKKDGNDEHLVDVANLAMMEFIEGSHQNKHFASIDDGHHTDELV